jgi:hypothetical protein
LRESREIHAWKSQQIKKEPSYDFQFTHSELAPLYLSAGNPKTSKEENSLGKLRESVRNHLKFTLGRYQYLS